MKFKQSLLIFSVLLSLSTCPVLALEPLNLPKWATGSGALLQRQASRSAELLQKRLTQIVQHADVFIANRIATLNNLIARIKGDSHLTDSEKTALTGQIQASISGLTVLKNTIDGDTTVESALADAQKIFSNFRIYAVLEPQVRLLIMLNNIQSQVTKVQGLIPPLQNMVITLQAEGKDVSRLTALLTDINSRLQAISATVSSDIVAVQNVTTATPDPQIIFKQIRTNIQRIIRTDFVQIRQNISQMRKIIRQLNDSGIHPAE